jgi:hypothetical protein
MEQHNYLVIREKFSFYERNMDLLFSFLHRVMNCAKIQGGIFVMYMPISEYILCLKIRWPENYFRSREMVGDVIYLCLSAQMILKFKLFLFSS